jgi:hypothetical protein
LETIRQVEIMMWLHFFVCAAFAEFLSFLEQYIWQIGVALTSSLLYFKYMLTFVGLQHQNAPSLLNSTNLLLKFLENTCLLILTCISSTENHDLHKMGFIGWAVFQTLGILFSFIL